MPHARAAISSRYLAFQRFRTPCLLFFHLSHRSTRRPTPSSAVRCPADSLHARTRSPRRGCISPGGALRAAANLRLIWQTLGPSPLHSRALATQIAPRHPSFGPSFRTTLPLGCLKPAPSLHYVCTKPAHINPLLALFQQADRCSCRPPNLVGCDRSSYTDAMYVHMSHCSSPELISDSLSFVFWLLPQHPLPTRANSHHGQCSNPFQDHQSTEILV